MSKFPANIGKGFAHLHNLRYYLRDMAYIDRLGKPVALDDAYVLSLTALEDSETEVTENITNPDVARNLVVTATKAGASVAGDVTIEGTNRRDEAISETITLDDTSVVAGVKAFKTVTKITLPGYTTEGDEVSVGVGNLLGMKYKLDDEESVITAFLGGDLENPEGLVTVDSSDISKDTIDLSAGTYDGEKRVSVLIKE